LKPTLSTKTHLRLRRDFLKLHRQQHTKPITDNPQFEFANNDGDNDDNNNDNNNDDDNDNNDNNNNNKNIANNDDGDNNNNKNIIK
jgi:hypothetical protein